MAVETSRTLSECGSQGRHGHGQNRLHRGRSWVFTRNLIRDILTFPLLADSTLALMDIDAERLEFARQAAQHFIDLGGYPAKVETTMDRMEALKGADVVICTVLAGGVSV